jgi:tRNA-dihydrouridine synthase B
LLLAPMEDVTDPPYRAVCKPFGVDIMTTEFVSSEGLVRDAKKSSDKMLFREEERPVGIQIFGSSVDNMKQAALKAEMRGPDFIDLNFGCPVRKVVVKGCGAALMNDVPKMIHMTRAVVESTTLPVTAKTRLGWDEGSRHIVDIAERLQDAGIMAISIHGRTRAQLYTGRADWTLIAEVKNNPRMKIPVFGNGDITSAVIAKEMKDRYGVDGLMIGRAAIGNPWIFREIKTYLETGELIEPPAINERLDVLKRHLELAVEYKGEIPAVLEMRKFYSGYLKGLPDIKKFKMKMMLSADLNGILQIISEIRQELEIM